MAQDTDNRNKRALMVPNPWLVPFLGRKLRDDQDDSETCFDCDFCPDENAGLHDIVFFVHFTTEDGILTDFEFEKYKDLSGGHGRPHPEDKNLTAADISRLVSILSAYTVPRAEPILEELLNKAKTTGFPGWTIDKATKSQIVFEHADDGSKQAISRKNILRALEWSFNYLDILDDPDFWKVNEKYIDYPHNSLLRSFFSLIDTSVYLNLGAQRFRKEYRDQPIWAHKSRAKALEAARDNDLETVRKLLKFATVGLSVEEEKNHIIPALSYATLNGNLEMVKLLVAHNAYREESFIYNGEQRVAATFAIEKGFDEILDVLLENPSTLTEVPHTISSFYSGDESMLKAALKTGSIHFVEKIARIRTRSIDISSIKDAAMLAALSYCQKQEFTADQLRSVYKGGYYEAARRISSGTNPLLHERIEDVLIEDAVNQGLDETKKVIERIYAPVSTTFISVFSDLWPFERYSTKETEEAITFLVSSRLPQPQGSEYAAEVLSYHNASQKIVKMCIRYCSKEMSINVIQQYPPLLSTSDRKKVIMNIIRIYSPQDMDFYLSNLPMLQT